MSGSSTSSNGSTQARHHLIDGTYISGADERSELLIRLKDGYGTNASARRDALGGGARNGQHHG
ncbi:MAG: hypothetical protein ACLS29_08930 [Prevotellamassilia sp.]